MLVIAASVVVAAQGQPLVFNRAIALPNVEGRIDHLAFDAARNRLFVAALGNNSVEVIDTTKGVHLMHLAGFHEPQGIAIVPDFNFMLIGAGFYHDRYRRTPEGWKISATGYDRTYDASLSTESLNFKVKQGRAVNPNP